MSNYKGIEYLRKKLEQKRERVLKRYKYYEMKIAEKERKKIEAEKKKAEKIRKEKVLKEGFKS